MPEVGFEQPASLELGADAARASLIDRAAVESSHPYWYVHVLTRPSLWRQVIQNEGHGQMTRRAKYLRACSRCWAHMVEESAEASSVKEAEKPAVLPRGINVERGVSSLNVQRGASEGVVGESFEHHPITLL